MDEIDRFLQRLQKLTTAAYLPAIYEGFVEADALVQSEDALLGLLRDYAQQLWQNRNLLSMTVEKVALFEEMLHLSPGASQSLDERRQTVADTVNGRFVLNDAKLHEICQALAPGFTVYERTDPQALTLGVFTEEDADDGSLPAVGIVDEIRPTVPQNLALYAGVDTAVERDVVVSHAHFSALWAGLGVVERHEVPPLIAGLMGGDEMRLYSGGSMNRGAIDYPECTFTENNEVYGDKIEIWHSSYTPHAVVFPEKSGDEPSTQFTGGTIRRWGTKANRCTAVEEVEGKWMSAGNVTYPVRTFTENHEVHGNRLEVWHSSYTPPAVVFPEATGAEPGIQMMAGTLRRWGTKANRGIDLAVVDGGSMDREDIVYPEREFTENHEIHGDTLKVYTKQYTPVIIVFPEKPQTEPANQMVGGTLRMKGTKANRGILLENINGQIMPN